MDATHSLSKAPPPIQKSISLLSLELGGSQLSSPWRPAQKVRSLLSYKAEATRLRGTRSLSLFSRCFLSASLSSWADNKSGLCADGAVKDGDWMIFTFCFSRQRMHQGSSQPVTGERHGRPAVKSVAASCAVLRNSSRSRSWVTDFRRLVESISVVYWRPG